MDQLYVMELLVNQIEFPTLPVPQKKQIVVQAKCGTFANLEIRTDVMGALETQERSEKSKILDINCGKSLLFAINPTTLKKNLKEYPLELAISTKLQTEPMGIADIPWTKEFLEMVESTEDYSGYVTPVEYRDSIPLSKNGNPAGNVGIYLRLTFLGHNIDTHIQVIEAKDSGAKQFLFKSNNNATTFQCQKYGLGSDTDVIPVAPIFKTAAANFNQQQSQPTRGLNQSVVSIFGKMASMASLQSVVPSVFRGITSNMVNPHYGLGSSHPSDTQSLRERVPNKLFMNFLDAGSTSNSDGLSMSDTSDIDLDNLTIEQIESMLCKHPDCPAAKLFKDFGIGPLAKGKALGSVDLKMEAPLSYGLTHLNGRIDNYGPLGTYRSPKSPSQDFVSKPDKSGSRSSCSSSKSSSYGSSASSRKRKSGLRGGSIIDGILIEPLRLKGGGRISASNIVFPMDEFSHANNDDNSMRNYQPKYNLEEFKQPEYEIPTKESLNQHFKNNKPEKEIPTIEENESEDITFRDNLHKYPFHFHENSFIAGKQNILKELPSTDSFSKKDISNELDLNPKKVVYQPAYTGPLRLKGGGPICGNENIPDPRHACQDLMDEFNKLLNDYKNALGPCGAATCPFSTNIVAEQCRKACKPESIVGTIKEDYEEEISATSPKVNTSCIEQREDDPPVKSKSCSSQVSKTSGCAKEPKKPKSACEDPECPFAKPDDEELSACANPDCPFKRDIINPADKDHKRDQIKSACGSPTCPFIREKYGIDDYEPEYPPLPCPGKGCPFQVPKQLPPIHWDCPDPLPKGECKNPECPLVRKENIIEKYFPQPRSPCGSPTCPFAVVPCNYPGCPFSVNSGDIDPCPPTCPYSEPPPTELKCTPSVCPFAGPGSEEELTCNRDNCPFQSKTSCKKENSKTERKSCASEEKETESEGICDNVCCPYRKKKTCDTKTEMSNSGFNVNNDNGEPCTATTCSKHGGTLSCLECGDGKGDENIVNKQKEMVTRGDKVSVIEEKKKKFSEQPTGVTRKGKSDTSADPGKKKRKKRRCGYVYDEGTYYPGNKVGHRFCVLPKFNVPPDMGWLWNVHTKCMSLRPRRGWKPGAIGKSIAKMINQHRKKLQMPLLDDKKKKKRRKGIGGGGGYGGDSSDEEVQLKPTLQVKKKDGIVYVTMNPLKDPKTIEDNENPYMDCSPMQFKIVKNKQKEFKMCYCGEENGEDVDVSSSSSSELDIEFTPPAGIIRPERLRKKKDVCHTDTQYNIEDCQLPKKEAPKKKGKGKGKDKKKKK